MQRFERVFRFWDFHVNRDQLLLRSPHGPTDPENLDIAFVGVEYVELPTKMRDLTLTRVDDSDCQRARQVLGRIIPNNQVFALLSGSRRYLVVAAAMKVFKNDLDMFESSLDHF